MEKCHIGISITICPAEPTGRCCFWKLSFGSLLVYRFWWVLQRAAIFTLLFRLISRYINMVSAFVACLFSIMLCAASVYDLLGDYNQTVILLSVILSYCMIAFHEANTNKQRYTKLFGAGFVLGLIFLNKQTIFLASGICVFCGPCILLQQEKRCTLWLVLPFCSCWCHSSTGHRNGLSAG